jgi:hypothetical protein
MSGRRSGQTSNTSDTGAWRRPRSIPS